MPVEFERYINRIFRDYRRRVNQTPKQITIDIFTRIINRTPIDYDRKDPNSVGLARGNWIATVGRFNKSVETFLDESGGRAPVLFARGPTVRNMERVINETSLRSNPRFYLTNNVSYIRRLEYLRVSMQAPFGMRAITLNEFPMIVEQRARREFIKRIT